MALYDNPPHTVSLLRPTTSRDAGGGTAVTYTTLQSSVPCSINTASASEQEVFSQMEMTVTHTVAILTSKLTSAPQRGDKATDSDGNSYHVHGISKGRSYGSIPAFHYLHCEEQLD